MGKLEKRAQQRKADIQVVHEPDPRVEIEIRPEDPKKADSPWRLYPLVHAVDHPAAQANAERTKGRALTQRGKVLGGSMAEAHAAAISLAATHNFQYHPTTFVLERVGP